MLLNCWPKKVVVFASLNPEASRHQETQRSLGDIRGQAWNKGKGAGSIKANLDRIMRAVLCGVASNLGSETGSV